MNILVFSWRDPKHPLAGGAEQVMHEHMKGWVEAGHSVTLFSSYFKAGKREEKLDGLKIIRRGVQLGGVQVLGALWYLFENHQKFDLVVDQFHGIPFFTPLYIRRKKLAVIQEVAKEVWLMNHLPKPFNWVVGIVGYIAEPFIFLFYKKVPFMTGSLSARKDLVKFGVSEKNITIVPHGVIVPNTKIKTEKEKIKTIVYLGALTKDKGIEEAIKTFAILNKNGMFQFWIIGRGSWIYLKEIKKLAANFKIPRKIIFWGFVSEKKKFELLSRAHILINSSAREGWGLVNIEANAMGVPVVAYNSPGLIDSVKDGASGIILQKNTPEEMVKTILDLLRDPVRYERLRESSVKWSKNFSWDKSKKESASLLDSVVSDKYSHRK